MMPGHERYAEVKRIFLQAERLPKGERTRFLLDACGEDAELQTQVRRLLTAEEQEPTFLETPLLEEDGAGIEPGAMLGRFRIVRVLGEGGMGVVYEAQEEEARRRVALKIIRAGLLSERLRSRFRHEIRVLGQLRHPGIAQIYEAGTLDIGGGRAPYFAMELVEGLPILDSAKAHVLGVRERLALVAQVCDAVHHAHQKGVIHRDLKPGNILVEELETTDASDSSLTGPPLRIKILDFGVARATDADVRAMTVQTDVGQLIGTLPYMSPEQATGDAATVDIRSDVYSIGVLAFELLSGRLPYEVRGRMPHEAARVIRDVEPQRLGSVDRALRGDAETVVGKALEKDRNARYQSAAEMAADIRRCLRDEPIVARPASFVYQFRKFARRHRPVVAAAALVLLSLVAATIVSTWQARVALRAKADADRNADTASRDAVRAVLAGTAAALESGDPIAARRLLNGTAERLRGWSWKYWNAQLDQCIARVEVGRAAGAWLSGDGSEVVAVGNDGGIMRGSPWGEPLKESARLERAPIVLACPIDEGRRIVAGWGGRGTAIGTFDASSGRLLETVTQLPEVASLGVLKASFDGAVVAVGARTLNKELPANEVWEWVRDEQGQWRGKLLRDGSVGDIGVSRDGRFLATGLDDAIIWESATAKQVGRITLAGPGLRFALSDDDELLATGGEDKAVSLWDWRSGKLLVTLRGHPGDITAIAIDPSGHRIVSSGRDQTVRMWDAESGDPLAVLSGHTANVRRLGFTADGSRAWSYSADGTFRLWQVNPHDEVSVLRGHTSFVYGVAFSPDGSRIISGGWDKVARVWDASGGMPLGVVGDEAPEQGFVTSIAASRDGKWIATGHKTSEWEHGFVRLWDAATGAFRENVGSGRGAVCDVVFSADSRHLWAAWDHRGFAEFDLGTSPPTQRDFMKGGEVRALALSPDERLVACGNLAGVITLFDAAAGTMTGKLEGHRGWIAGLVFHPTLPLLASVSTDGTARLWDTSSLQCKSVLAGHWDKVYATAFSPDGALLATGSDDTTIVIWDVASAEEKTRLRGHTAYVYSLAFSPDGSRLASASGDGTVRIWDTRPVHERWRARMAR